METVIAKSRVHLMILIKNAIDRYGSNCDLNWIDVSQVKDLSWLFSESQFNGDISQWDVSHAMYMRGMFAHSKFNGDISQWDVSNVISMDYMFRYSDFNGDISNWDVSNVDDMQCMFQGAKFNGDITPWLPTMKKHGIDIEELMIPEENKMMKMHRKQRLIQQIILESA